MKKYHQLIFISLIAILGSCSKTADNKDNSTSTDTTTVVEKTTESSVTDNGSVINGTQETLDSLLIFNKNGDIRARGDKPVVIDFNATWCPPCQEFGPIFHKVAADMASQAIFVSIDIDETPLAKEQFGISAIPQISVVKPDGIVDSHVGYMTEDMFRKVLRESL